MKRPTHCFVSLGFYLIFLFQIACSRFQELDIEYVINIPNSLEGVIEVQGSIKNVSHLDSLKLVPFGQSELIRESDFRVFNTKNHPIPHTTIKERLEYFREPKTLNNKKIEIDNSIEQINFSYKVEPGGNMKSRGMKARFVYGYLGSEFGLVSGRNLFLVPNEKIKNIKVTFKMPQSWGIITPWKETTRRNTFLVDGTEGRGKEFLINSVIGIGSFTEITKEIKGTKVSVYSFRKTNSEFLLLFYRDDPCNAYSGRAPNAYHSF